MKFLYKPFGLIAGLIASRLGRKLFEAVWARFDEAEPPDPKAPHTHWVKAVLGRVVEAATMAGTAAAVERASARAFYHLTGAWPGEDPEPR